MPFIFNCVAFMYLIGVLTIAGQTYFLGLNQLISLCVASACIAVMVITNKAYKNYRIERRLYELLWS